MALFGISSHAQQRNVLRVPDMTVKTGNVQLPVNIENTDEIVGAQFDITLPTGITAQTVGTLSNRSNGHSVSVNKISNGNYRVLLHSAQNKTVLGQSGVMMYLPISIPTSFEEGSEYPIVISNAVLGKASGENVLTEAISGKIRIAKMPDLVVNKVTCDKQEFAPGEHIFCSWQVGNIGEIATSGGWSEQISLVSEDGSLSKIVATTNYDGILEANATVSRQAEISLPYLLGIDGPVRVQVQIVSTSKTGEIASAQGNNTKQTDESVTVKKSLIIEISPNCINEEDPARIALLLTRTGNWNTKETFNLSASADSRISLPESITIPANQSGTAVYFNVKDNDVVDDNQTVHISVSGNNYPEIESSLDIIDNEYPSLHLEASKKEITEGETFQLTISTDYVSGLPINVMLTSQNNHRFDFPSTAVIPAGETSVNVSVITKDDDLPSETLSNLFTASAQNHNKAELVVDLADNDMPVLELTLTPTTVQESVGVIAVAGILRRTTNKDSKITVKLTDDANGGLYFGTRSLELAKGVEEVHFNFGPVDNAIVDQDRTYTITAAVWLSSCGCSATGESAGYVTAQLTVLDNDGPALSIATSEKTLKEGGKTNLTISRNTTDTSSPLAITLSSNYEEGLSYEHNTVIPAGEQMVSVELTSAANALQGDSHTVIFTVKADNYASGTCYMMVTDQTLPDASFKGIAAVNVSDNSALESAEVGSKAKLTFELTNDGAATLPAETPVKVYLKGQQSAIGTIYTSDEIPVGGTLTISKVISLPSAVGNHSYYAVVNADNSVSELSYTNNTSVETTIRTIAPFSATVKTNKSVYKQGEKVFINGQLSGNGTANAQIDLYVINEGARQVKNVVTDAQGAFSYEWELYALQAGEFIVGACYPNEGLTTEMASFYVYGLKRSDNNYITCQIADGETAAGSISFYNPGESNLTGVKAEIIETPDNCIASVDIPSIVEGLQTVDLNYTLKGTKASKEVKWDEVKVKITANEDFALNTTILFYCYNNTAFLTSDLNRINATITEGTTRDYTIHVVNTGKGSSGNITLNMPDFMNCVSGSTIPSLNYYDTATVVLRIKNNDKMQLNLPVIGKIGINCANGQGLSIPYTIEMVSEEQGKLIIDVCDEFTYNTAEAPHVSGAEVIISHPYTGTEIAKDTTNDAGTFSVDLPAGYYKVVVNKENHESYNNFCYVNPGKTEKVIANISYQPITVEWNVEETEIEDQYEIVSTVKYETNVPKPVVKITLPERIDGDNMAIGDAVLIDMQLTNVGLINAEDVELLLPSDMKEWKFEALSHNEPFLLAPQQTVSVPILITRIAEEQTSNSQNVPASRDIMNYFADQQHPLFGTIGEDVANELIYDFPECVAGMAAAYKNRCGTELKDNKAAERLVLKTCIYSSLMQAAAVVINRIFGPGKPQPGGGSGGSGGGDPVYTDAPRTFDICNPCDAEKAERWINFLTGKSYLSNIDAIINHVVEGIQEGKTYKVVIKYGGEVVKEGGLELLDTFKEGAGTLVGYTFDIIELIKPCEESNNTNNSEQANLSSRRKAPELSWQEQFKNVAETYVHQINALDSILLCLYGDRIWYEEFDEEKAKFIKYVTDLEDGHIPSEQEILNHKPSSVTIAQAKAYVSHVINENQTILDELEKNINTYQTINEQAAENGFSSMTEYFDNAFEECSKKYEEMRASSVCASITLQFKQTMTITRQAFKGTLIVFNGHESIPMKDVKLNLKVKNAMTGAIATSREFQINTDNLVGFDGELNLSTGWTLNAKATGTATILFIPTKYAAPTEPVNWSFGGTLSYIDPFTGLEVTRDLNPVTLTVRPCPELDLDYFLQRDIYGDDPLTTEIVEPTVPAELALIINNKGYGDATNVRMVTQQPEIVENEKGLLIDFEFVNSQLNGKATSDLKIGEIPSEFGTIPAHSQMYAQWWFTSSLLGHFTEYKVEAKHITSFGNEDLSLIDRVKPHELIHGFTFNNEGQTLRGFLVNDVPDDEDLPEEIYFTNATQQEVHLASAINMTKKGENVYELKINATEEAGWYYGSLLDPTFGKATLCKITRANGTEIDVDNMWQTDRTLRDGKDPLYENRLHFVCNLPTEGETFQLTFEPKPELELSVESFIGVPEEGSVLNEPLNSLNVKFNKPVKTETFTSEDITLSCEGKNQNASLITVEKLSEQEYQLNLNESSLSDGYYVLTVQTAGIEDEDGFTGATGKQATWLQYEGGKVDLIVKASPSEGGSATPGTGRFDYDSDVTLSATETEGYEFVEWLQDGQTISDEQEFTYHLVSNTELTAVFSIKNYKVEFDCNEEQGIIAGASTGIYNHGTQFELQATPKEGFLFEAWTVNGEIVGEEPILTLTIDGAMKVEALFAKEILYDLGDANGDNSIDVGDISAIVNYIQQKAPANFVEEVADANSDGDIDVGDITAIVNLIVEAANNTSVQARAMNVLSDAVSAPDIAKMNNVIFMPPVTIQPGEKLQASIMMNNTSSICGYQFEIKLPEGITIPKDEDGFYSAELSTERTSAKKHSIFEVAKLTNGNYIVICSSTSNATFQNNNGEVAKLTLAANADLPQGTYEVQLADVRMSDTEASVDHVGNITAYAIGQQYARNVSADWGTLALPYATQSTDDVQLYQLAAADLSNGTLTVKPTDHVEANTPCLFKRLDSEAQTISFPVAGNGVAKDVTVSTATDVNGWTFMGTYYNRTLIPASTSSIYYISNDHFWFANEAFEVGAFRGWFETAIAAVGSFRIVVSEDDITAIEDLNGSENASVVYDLQGRRQQHAKPGDILIVNNKKQLVK